MTDVGELYALFERASSMDREARERLIAGLEDRELAEELRSLLEADDDEGAVPHSPTAAPILDGAGLDGAGLARRTSGAPDRDTIRREIKTIAAQSRADGRYELGDELGRGAMGSVRRAVDRPLQRELAMKTILEPGPGGADLVRTARFLNEARVLGRLDHPGIVSIHELGVDAGGRPYFTMPIVEGGDLRAAFDKARRGTAGWSTTRAVGALLRVCEAMAYAHSHGVVHRDLKPSNVMVGRFGEVQIMDWGLARLQGQRDDHDLTPEGAHVRADGPADDSPVRTADGAVLGTPYYMPPEQAAGDIDRIDERSDVYAIGAMLYELLSGRRPYENPTGENSPYAILARIAREPPPPLAELQPNVAPELSAVCEKAMRRDPAQRYPHMESLATDLRAFLESRVVTAYRTGPFTEFKMWVRRNRLTALALGVLIAVTLGGSSLIAFLESASAERERELTGVANAEAETARQEREAANRALDFLVGLFESPNPQVTHGNEPTVRELLGRGAEAIATELQADPLVRARLQLTMGRAYRELGAYQEATPLIEAAYEQRRVELGELHIATLEARTELGLLLKRKGDLVGAEVVYRETLADNLALHGERHPETLIVTNNLANVLMLQERYEEALELQHPCVEIGDEVRGKDDLESVTALNTLGQIYEQMARFEEAEPYLRESLARMDRTVGRRSANGANALANLARALVGLEKLEEASALLEEAVDVAREVLPDGHWSYYQSLKALARVRWLTGRTDEAEAMLLECIEGSAVSLGEDHTYRVGYLSALGALYSQLGRWEEAEAINLDLLGRIPESTRSYYIALYNLASSAWSLNRPEDARARLIDLLRHEDSAPSGTHLPFARARVDLAEAEAQSGNPDVARLLLEDVHRKDAEVLRSDLGYWRDAMIRLAHLRLQSGETEGALALCRELLELSGGEDREIEQLIEELESR